MLFLHYSCRKPPCLPGIQVRRIWFPAVDFPLSSAIANNEHASFSG